MYGNSISRGADLPCKAWRSLPPQPAEQSGPSNEDYDNCSVETNYDSISLPYEKKTPATPLDPDMKTVTDYDDCSVETKYDSISLPCEKKTPAIPLDPDMKTVTDYDDCSVETKYDSISLPCEKKTPAIPLDPDMKTVTDYDDCSVETKYDSISLPCEKKTPAIPLDPDMKTVTGPSIFSPAQWKKYWKRNQISVLLILTGICVFLSFILLLSSISIFSELQSLNLSSTKEVCDASPVPFNFTELETSVIARFKGLEQQFDEKRKVSLQKMEEQLCRIEKKIDMQNCRDIPWRRFRTHVYYFSETEENWEMARQKCANCDSHLVIINNKQEQDFVAQILKQAIWLGLSDKETEGSWRWVDGSPLGERSWRHHEPNNGGANGEDCAVLYKEGLWNDIHCSSQVRFVCEKEEDCVQ